MVSKFNRLLLALFLGIFLSLPYGGYTWAAEKCEQIVVDKSKPLLTEKFSVPQLRGMFESYLKEQSLSRNDLTLSKAKGVLGEVAARDAIENKLLWYEKDLVSITTMFRKMGCNVQSYLRDNADRGIDDIFVVLRVDGWIDQNFNPVFHEAKYDGNCKLRLKKTSTLCNQLSVQWLKGNLQKAHSRTNSAKLCVGGQEIFAKSCHDCRKAFQDNVRWLRRMLKGGHFYRTASVLCEDGTLSIYEVNEK